MLCAVCCMLLRAAAAQQYTTGARRGAPEPRARPKMHTGPPSEYTTTAAATTTTTTTTTLPVDVESALAPSLSQQYWMLFRLRQNGRCEIPRAPISLSRQTAGQATARLTDAPPLQVPSTPPLREKQHPSPPCVHNT